MKKGIILSIVSIILLYISYHIYVYANYLNHFDSLDSFENNIVNIVSSDVISSNMTYGGLNFNIEPLEMLGYIEKDTDFSVTYTKDNKIVVISEIEIDGEIEYWDFLNINSSLLKLNTSNLNHLYDSLEANSTRDFYNKIYLENYNKLSLFNSIRAYKEEIFKLAVINNNPVKDYYASIIGDINGVLYQNTNGEDYIAFLSGASKGYNISFSNIEYNDIILFLETLEM